MGFCSFDDITDRLMNSSTDTEKHEEKHKEIHRTNIKEEPKPALLSNNLRKKNH